jgi:Nif-specific regulatory protein
MATGTTIDTPAALIDPRFSGRESIQVGRIEAVLCVPVGSDPPIGAVYLQGEASAGPFDAAARESAELFAGELRELASRLLAPRSSTVEEDPTEAYRDRIRAESLIGHSAAMADLLRSLSHVVPFDVGILLTGDSGTGKSLVARLIHENGSRRGEPFVELNCAAIPEGLVESELFGAVEGAHSTATRRLPGKVEAAERGTLFLDEVSELPASAQAKLLQLLQSHTYFPLGATKPNVANIRIVAASNTDLELAVREGRFREDLYYRLHVLLVRVPSLEERREDIVLLAQHFVALASQSHRLPRLRISPAALRALENAPWPGNVRQLEHAIEAAVIRATGERADQIELQHVFPEAAAATRGSSDPNRPLTFQEATRRFQADYLATMLAETGWNVSEAARRLDLARSHVYSLIRAFDLERS